MAKMQTFLMLVSKNLRKQWQHKLTIITAIILPVLLSFLIIILRLTPNISDAPLYTVESIEYTLWWDTLINKINSRREQMIKEEKTFQSNVFVPNIIVGYAPNATDGLRKLFEGAMSHISLKTAQIFSFNDCAELRIRAHMEHYIASVCFHSVDETQSGLPLKLTYSILMPSELRYYEDSWIGNNWHIYNIYNTYSTWFRGNTNVTNVSCYVREGFISLQYYIGIEYLQMTSGVAKLPDVLLRTFNVNDSVYDVINESIDSSVLVLLLGFMFPVTVITKEIVEERELSAHYLLNKTPNAALSQLAAWYFNGFCLMLMTSLIFILILKAEWNGNVSIIKKCPWGIILFFFTFFVLSAVSFCLLIAIIVRTTKMVLLIIPMFWIVASLPLLMGQTLDSSHTNVMLIVASFLFCNVTLCRGLKKILCFEKHASRLSAGQYLMSTVANVDPTILTFIGYFCVQTFLFILTILALDGHVCPNVSKLVKCMPCRFLLKSFRRWIRQRQHRKRKIKEREEDIQESLSRRISDFIEEREQLIETIEISKPDESSDVSNLKRSLSNTTYTTTTNEYSNDSSSSKSKSDPVVPKDPRPSEFDKKLTVWLSSDEVRKRSEPYTDDKERHPKYFLHSSAKIQLSDKDSSESDINSSSDVERGPVVIKFENVWKKYSKTFVVRNFSLQVHKNEMLVLLGHNAAGKRTILSMACGQTEPSYGSVFIEGHNVMKRPARAFANVGSSLQHLNLFNEFTVAEHIAYFCRLRGSSLSQAKQQVNLYLQALRIKEQAEVPVTTLSNGLKRLLQVLCAFAGSTQIVLLDRPMEGISADKRRLFYHFILHQRLNRTILITTNYPNVASNLGDRIAILINGKLLACGKERHLYRRDNNVYRLICYLGTQCNFIKLFNFCAYHIPSLELESKMGDTASFVIEHSNHALLYKFVQLLSLNEKDLHLDSFKIGTTALEQILYTSEMRRKDKREKYLSNTLPSLATRIRNIEETKRSRKRQVLADISRVFLHIEIVLRKRFLTDIRNLSVPFLQLILPSLLCTWCSIQTHLILERIPLQPIPMTINIFDNTITLLSQRGLLHPVRAASKHYLEHASLDQRIIAIDDDDEIVNYIRQYTAKNLILTDVNFVVAAIFSDQTVEALYNNNLIHSAPVSLNMVMNALAVGFVSPDSGINVELELLPYSTLHSAYIGTEMGCMGWVIFNVISLSFCFIWSLPLLDFNLSESKAYDRIELIGGMRIATLGFANFIYGVLVIFLSMIPLNAFLLLSHNSLPMDLYANFTLILIVLLAGIYVMSLNILLSFWIRDLPIGYLINIIIYATGLALYISHYEWRQFRNIDSIAEFGFLPYYALLRNLMEVDETNEAIDVCSDVQTYETSVHLEQCQHVPNCCHEPSIEGVLLDLTWTAYLAVLLIWAFIYIRYVLNISKSKPPSRCDDLSKDSDPDSCFDQTVLLNPTRNEYDDTWIHEKIRLRTMERPTIRTKALHVENLGVFLRNQVVLNHINFLVERYQIVTVVGANNSGKTVLIKTILGAFPQSTGSISCYGKHSYQYSDHDNYKLIGYCAQEDDTIKERLTVVEYIQTVLTIRGLSKDNALEETINLLKIFDLYNSRYHLLPDCSRGVLKRLRIAISLIGYASLILLDDPFAYLDVSSQINIFSLIQLQCSNGQAVLYTSSDPSYCDYANRTSMLSNATLCVVGERQDLQINEFAPYIIVTALIEMQDFQSDTMYYGFGRLSRVSKCSTNDHNTYYFEACSIIEHHFPHAIIQNVTNRNVCFLLSRYTYTISYILEVLHKNRRIFFSFRIASPLLKTLFNMIVEQPKITTQIIENEDI